MEDAFRNPPASVYDTYCLCIERFVNSEEPIDLLQLVAFVYVSAAGRLVSALPPPDKCRRQTDAIALQVREEALRVLREAAHATDGERPLGQALNG